MSSILMFPNNKKTGLAKKVVVPYAPSFVKGASNKPLVRKTVDPSKIKKTGSWVAPGYTLVPKVKKKKGKNLSEAIKANVEAGTNAALGIAKNNVEVSAAGGAGGASAQPVENEQSTTTSATENNKTPWGMIIAVVLVFAGIAIYALKK